MVSVSDVYGGTHRYFTKVAKAHGVQVTFSPSIEIDVAELIRPDETKLIWVESPRSVPTQRPHHLILGSVPLEWCLADCLCHSNVQQSDVESG